MDLTYDDLVAIGARSLKRGERWCIWHPEGKAFEETASLDFTRSVRIICGALEMDWDELQEQGYWLGIVPASPAGP